jgi:hypothetical protein
MKFLGFLFAICSRVWGGVLAVNMMSGKGSRVSQKHVFILARGWAWVWANLLTISSPILAN